MSISQVEKRQRLAAFALISPATFFMLILLLGPVFVVFVMSFTNWQLGAKSFEWVGFRNYLTLLQDRIFLRSVLNTFVYTMTVVPFSVLLGLVAALLIHGTPGCRRFYRVAYFLPVMATFVAMVVVWEYILHPSFGIINSILKGLGMSPVAFLRNEKTVLFTIAGIGIWQQAGYNMVLFLSGLSGIHAELYQAADVDGASGFWDRFTLVTLPQLTSITFFVVIISTVRSFQVFESVHVLTGGGPNHSSEVMIYTMYEEGFQFFRTGYASAISILFLLVIVIITILKKRNVKKEGLYL